MIKRKTSLSPRQVDILRLLAQGKTRVDAAAALGLSLSTLNKHLERAFRFLGVSNVVEAVLKFIARLPEQETRE